MWQTCKAEQGEYNYYQFPGSNYGNYPNNYHSNYGNNEQDSNSDNDRYKDYKDYSQNYANYGFDYSVVGPGDAYEYEDMPKSIECYSCHFDIQYGHTKGMPECNNPFVETTIPVVSCVGPCGVSLVLSFPFVFSK